MCEFARFCRVVHDNAVVPPERRRSGEPYVAAVVRSVQSPAEFMPTPGDTAMFQLQPTQQPGQQPLRGCFCSVTPSTFFRIRVIFSHTANQLSPSYTVEAQVTSGGAFSTLHE